MRSIIPLLILAYGCGPTLHEALSRMAPTTPQPPLTPQDSAVAVVLAYALTRGTADFSPRPLVILQRGDGLATAHAIPSLDSVRVFLLEDRQIRQLANKYGDLNYLVAIQPTIDQDTAAITVVTRWAFRPRPDGIGVVDGGGACSWRVRRGETGWVIDTMYVCIIS
jgi:hypothetical protein